MRASYLITFQYEYEPNIFKRVTREYHIPITDINYPLIGCIELEKAMKKNFSRHFKNIKYITGDFNKFKTSRECRKSDSYHKVYYIKNKQNYQCIKCNSFRTHINQYDTNIELGFCPVCKGLIKLIGE